MLETREWLDRLAPDTSQPLSKVRQLYLNLYNAITSGEIPDGTRLPSSRSLSQQLGVGRNTVIAAYQQLADEQLINGNGRAGSRVNFSAMKLHNSVKTSTSGVQRDVSLKRSSVNPLRHFCRSDPLAANDSGTPSTISAKRPSTLDSSSFSSSAPADFAPGMPDTSLFPREQWRRALVKASRLSSVELGYQNGPLRDLQEAIARFLAIYRSLVVSPEQIIVTSGTRQSLVLAAALYSRPGDIAWVESPGYPTSAYLFNTVFSVSNGCSDGSRATKGFIVFSEPYEFSYF